MGDMKSVKDMTEDELMAKVKEIGIKGMTECMEGISKIGQKSIEAAEFYHQENEEGMVKANSAVYYHLGRLMVWKDIYQILMGVDIPVPSSALDKLKLIVD